MEPGFFQKKKKKKKKKKKISIERTKGSNS